MRHITFLLLMFSMLAWNSSSAQLYSETFNAAGKGAVGPQPVTFDYSGVNWTLSGDFSGLTASSDWFRTSNGRLEARDLDGGICFESPNIDISSAPSVTFSVDLSESGRHESSDYIDVTLFVDGIPMEINDYLGMGSATRTIVDDFSPVTVFVSGISGNSLQIQICAKNNAGSEYLRMDNISVTANTPMPCGITDISRNDLGGCDDNGTPFSEDDTFLSDITVNYENPPSGGSLVLELNGSQVASAAGVGGTSHVFAGLSLPANAQNMLLKAFFSDDTGCQYTENLGTAPGPCSVMPDCSYPFFSEYVEGSGFNKCLEIYNPTGSDIYLAEGYRIEIYFNGNSNPGNTIFFDSDAVIPPGGTYVVCSPAAGDQFLALADQTGGGNSWFNGDDAVALMKKVSGGLLARLDVIGQIGVDPGSQWNVNGVETKDQTLRRMSWVQAGDNNGNDTFDPSAQWIEYDKNAEWGLGNHATNCIESDLPIGWNSINIGCTDGSAEYDSQTQEWILSSDCFNPLAGQDDLTYAFQENCGDAEMSAKLESISGLGNAGLMFRESTNPGSKYVWIYKTGGNSFHWAIRDLDNGNPQISIRPAFGKKWMKIKREGSIFSGYSSSNGILWKKEFQSFVFMDDCLFAGMAVHSNVDAANTTAVFSNVSFGGGLDLVQSENNDAEESYGVNRENHSTAVIPEIAQGTQVPEVTLRPNPVSAWLEVSLPDGFGEDIIVSVMDLNGRILYNKQYSDGNTLIDLDLASMNLSEGTYLLNLRSGIQNVTKRFVLVR